MALTDEQRTQLVDEALDAAVIVILDALGEETGDFASIFFSGPDDEGIRKILSDFIVAQEGWLTNTEEEQ